MTTEAATIEIDHHATLDGTPAVAIAMRGMAELLADGAADQSVGLHGSYKAITATRRGEVCGVIVWFEQPESKRIWLVLGYVLPEHRGSGVYRQLWASLVDKARDLRMPEIWSATSVKNHRMRDVAKAQGRVEVAVTLRYVVPPAEVVVS